MAWLYHAMQIVVDAERLHAPLEGERVRAFEFFDSAQLACHVASLALDHGRVRHIRALVDSGRDAGHRWQVIAAVLAFDIRRECPAHGEPHDDFGTLEAAKLSVFGD